MKTTLTLITFLVFAFNSFTQQYMWTPYSNYKTKYEVESESTYGRYQISNNKIKSITTIRVYDGGKPYKSSINYTPEGYVNTYVWYKNELPVKKEYSYNEYSKINQVKNYDKKGSVIWESNYTFNSDTLVTLCLNVRKGKEYSKLIIDYNNKKIVSSNYYKKGNTAPETTYKYSFYDNGSKKETDYFKKGKLKYTWNYDCKNEGEVVQKHKDTTQVCSWDEFDANGHFVKWMQTTNEKNEIRKTKRVFEKEGDKKAIAYYSYNSKGLPTYSWEQSESYFKNYNYNKKGKLTSTYQVNYDEDEKEIKRISTWFKRGKELISSSDISYNERGQKTSEIATNSKGEITKTEYSYEYY